MTGLANFQVVGSESGREPTIPSGLGNSVENHATDGFVGVIWTL
jgi:hypothetical protein